MFKHDFMFPSVVSTIECINFKAIQSNLIEWIYNYRKNDSGVVLSNQGGWQSNSDFFEDKTFDEHKNYILFHVNEIFNDLLDHKVTLGNMWININKKYDFNWPHIHPECVYSGVFWIKCPKDGGNLRFTSPQNYNTWAQYKGYKKEFVDNYFLSDNWEYDCTKMEGKILTFPGSLMHCVTPNQSDEDRISIAFNLQLDI